MKKHKLFSYLKSTYATTLLLLGVLVPSLSFASQAISLRAIASTVDYTSQLLIRPKPRGPAVTQIDRIQQNPDEYIGKTVTLTGAVQTFMGSNAFTLDDLKSPSQEYLLIISRTPLKNMTIGQRVQVTGTVFLFNQEDLIRQANLDVSTVRGISSFYRNLPVVVVDSPQVLQ